MTTTTERPVPFHVGQTARHTILGFTGPVFGMRRDLEGRWWVNIDRPDLGPYAPAYLATLLEPVED